ncbi:MAG: Yae1 family protein [Spirochaetales bacterium]|nr:Yae1 family protein [Spirochaetales bacterium]
MKKGLSVVFLLSILLSGVFAQEERSITIKNETGYNIIYLYFSPSDYDDWGDDFLEGLQLADGESIDVKLSRDYDVSQNIYDLQAVDEDDDYYTIYETDISNNPLVTITMDNYDGGSEDDDYDYDDEYSGYDDGYSDGYTEGYKLGYTEAFRDAYLEGFRAAQEIEVPADSWR